MPIPNYSSESYLPTRFFSHLHFSLKYDLGERTDDCKKNLLEKVGDAGLWSVEFLPGKLLNISRDPKVVTLALTALALVAVSFAFYPGMSLITLKAAAALLPTPPLWAAKFGAYVYTCSLILSASARAEGRFFNAPLLANFYAANNRG